MNEGEKKGKKRLKETKEKKRKRKRKGKRNERKRKIITKRNKKERKEEKKLILLQQRIYRFTRLLPCHSIKFFFCYANAFPVSQVH